MKKLLDLLTQEMGQAFEAAGYDAALGKVGLSNRPDLCEFQCNGAMAGAKQYHKAPIMIANEVAAKLSGSQVFEEVQAVAPGFLNLKIGKEFLKDILVTMQSEPKFGLEAPEKPKMIVID
ncbi:MAG: arginine--tRNA ligase, partial [Lachnospiraceae bacterium]|nr:arginine--tRNA ligase [Lachnospiraceae bacterium]